MGLVVFTVKFDPETSALANTAGLVRGEPTSDVPSARSRLLRTSPNSKSSAANHRAADQLRWLNNRLNNRRGDWWHHQFECTLVRVQFLPCWVGKPNVALTFSFWRAQSSHRRFAPRKKHPDLTSLPAKIQNDEFPFAMVASDREDPQSTWWILLYQHGAN